MNFIVTHSAIAAFVLMMFATITTVAVDMSNGATVRHLWKSLSRDWMTTAVALLIVYAVCFLVVCLIRWVALSFFLHA